jgi:hypothetical protein
MMSFWMFSGELFSKKREKSDIDESCALLGYFMQR